MQLRNLGLAAIGVFGMATAANAATVQTTDFIADASRTAFVGFENVVDSDTTYTEDGVTVTQINPDIDGLYQCGTQCLTTSTGKQWYPYGGDTGYTEITLASGGDFSSIGMDIGNGWGANTVATIFYELLDGGTSVLFGSFASASGYLGFTGGGFDTLRIAATQSPLSFFGDRTYQALAIDNIELTGSIAPVPVPAALPLLLAALGGLGFAGRRRKTALAAKA